MKTTAVRIIAIGEIVEILSTPVHEVDYRGFIHHKWVAAEPDDHREFEDEEIEWID